MPIRDGGEPHFRRVEIDKYIRGEQRCKYIRDRKISRLNRKPSVSYSSSSYTRMCTLLRAYVCMGKCSTRSQRHVSDEFRRGDELLRERRTAMIFIVRRLH